MRDDDDYLLALCDEADEEVRSQLRLICERAAPDDRDGPARRKALPRRPETARRDAR